MSVRRERVKHRKRTSDARRPTRTLEGGTAALELVQQDEKFAKVHLLITNELKKNFDDTIFVFLDPRHKIILAQTVPPKYSVIPHAHDGGLLWCGVLLYDIPIHGRGARPCAANQALGNYSPIRRAKKATHVATGI